MLQMHEVTRYRKLMPVEMERSCVPVMAQMICSSLGLRLPLRALVPKTNSSSMLLTLSPSQSFSALLCALL